MPFEINYEKDVGLVVAWSGVVTYEDIVSASKVIGVNVSVNQLRYEFWDYSAAERFQITHDEVRNCGLAIGDLIEKNPNLLIAFIGTEKFFAGYDRLYRIYGKVWGGLRSKTFPTQSEAREWVASIHPHL